MRTTLIHQAQHQDALRPAAFLLPTWEEGPCPLVQLLVHLRCADLLILSEDFPLPTASAQEQGGPGGSSVLRSGTARRGGGVWEILEEFADMPGGLVPQERQHTKIVNQYWGARLVPAT